MVPTPDDVLAALVPDRRVLARSGPVVLMLSHIDAYPTGCRFYVRAVAHRDDSMAEDDWWDLHDMILEGSRRRGRRSRQQLPDTLLRFGIQYTDGTKASTTGGPLMPHPDQEPDGPVLLAQGGGGGGGDRQMGVNRPVWLWPLPPPEPFDLVFEWPAVGVELARVQIDGAAIVAASRDCQSLFPSGR